MAGLTETIARFVADTQASDFPPNALCTPHLGYVEWDYYEALLGTAVDQSWPSRLAIQ